MAATCLCAAREEERAREKEYYEEWYGAARTYEGAGWDYRQEGNEEKSREMFYKAADAIIKEAIWHRQAGDYFLALAYYNNAKDLYDILGDRKRSDAMAHEWMIVYVVEDPAYPR